MGTSYISEPRTRDIVPSDHLRKRAFDRGPSGVLRWRMVERGWVNSSDSGFGRGFEGSYGCGAR